MSKNNNYANNEENQRSLDKYDILTKLILTVILFISVHDISLNIN